MISRFRSTAVQEDVLMGDLAAVITVLRGVEG